MRINSSLFLLCCAGLALLGPACHRKGTSRSASEASWEDRAWLDKAVRALLYGKSQLTPAEEEHLLSLPREAAIDEMMTRPEFGNTVLDLNLFFQGSKLEKLKNPYAKGFSNEATDSHSALIAAREVMTGGDYFKLFDWTSSYFIAFKPLNPVSYDEDNSIREKLTRMTSEERLSYYVDLAKSDLMALTAKLESGSDPKSICDEIENQDRKSNFQNALYSLELPKPFDDIQAMGFEYALACGTIGAPAESSVIRRVLLTRLSNIQKDLDVLPKLLKLMPTVTAEFVGDMTRIERADIITSIPLKSESFGDSLWTQLPNSSTNMNRRRSAYMLKTYFCDDLTPINIVAPTPSTEHSEHASDAGCAACHYKLDPMAGFFRYRGASGSDFQNLNFYFHDDLLKREGDDFTSYLSNWKSVTSDRTWNVGYTRSATKPALNDYGESLDDLFAIIRKSRESKVCLTKKMAAYILGEGQVYDGRWIDSLAEKFQQAAQDTAPASASSQAFKDVYKSMLLSKAFTTPDPDQQQCYDFAPGAAPSSLPCAVAFIIEKNCTTCHKGGGAPAGLDLSLWEKNEKGEMNFHHIDRKSAQPVAVADTLDRIKERLSSSDSKRQMPLMRAMDPVERAALFKWIDTLQRGKP